MIIPLLVRMLSFKIQQELITALSELMLLLIIQLGEETLQPELRHLGVIQLETGIQLMVVNPCFGIQQEMIILPMDHMLLIGTLQEATTQQMVFIL